jgi:hypothetical protein
MEDLVAPFGRWLVLRRHVFVRHHGDDLPGETYLIELERGLAAPIER